MKKVRACDGGAVDIESAGTYVSLPECPVKWMRAQPGLIRVYNYAQHYRAHGILPRVGGLEDQPQAVMDAINIVTGELYRIDKYEAELRTIKHGH